MPLQKLQFRPGINREGTQYSDIGGYYDCDKVRFRQGRPEQIGGWTKYLEASFLGVCRLLHDWSTAVGDTYLGLGTSLKYYVETGSTYNDITPIRETTAAGDVTFSATASSSTLTVSDTSHGAVANDFVTFSGAVTLGGLITADVLNQEYQIVSIVDADSYTITAKDTNGDDVTANGSDTGNGGASVVGAYQLNTGTNAFVSGGTGWGVGPYGSGTWSSSISLSFTNQLRLWSTDEFGDDIIINPRGGSVFYWDESAGTSVRAVDLSTLGGASDTPTVCLQIMVSDVDRHVIAFGCNTLGSGTLDPLLVRWSDQENAVDWTPTATNTAGGQVLSTGTIIIGAVKTRREILIFTDVGLTSMRFSGPPYVYSFSVIAENVSMISPNAGVAHGDSVFFMDREGFYLYNGAVQRIPCPVFKHVYENLQLQQSYKVFATINHEDSEVMWFYPVGDATADITNYVSYNYLDNVWAIGTMARGAWIPAATKSYPIASSNDTAGVNYLYNQEYGYDADGSDIGAYVETGAIEITDGEKFMFVRRLIPDFRLAGTTANADFTVTIKGRRFPLETLSSLDTATVTSSTTQNHIRCRTREIALRIDANNNGYGWTMGDFRLDLRPDGRQ